MVFESRVSDDVAGGVVSMRRHELAARRKAVGLSQERLAEILNVDRSTVARWERGDTEPLPWFRPRLARALKITIEQVADLLAEKTHRNGTNQPTVDPAPQEIDHDVQRRQLLALGPAMITAGIVPAKVVKQRTLDPLSDGLRRSLLTYSGVPEPAQQISISAAESLVRQVNDLYQAADYVGTAEALPSIISQVESLTITSTQSIRSSTIAAMAYLAASRLAAKTGDAELAWIAADRAGTHALHTGNAALMAVASRQTATALMKLPHRVTDAETVAHTAYDQLVSGITKYGASPAALSAQGALLLVLAMIASRANQSVVAAQRLNAAADLAERLGGDANHLWTAFGPTNVLLHKVSAAVALRKPREAIAMAQHLNTSTLPSTLVSRRAQIHLDLAAAFSQSGTEDAPAVLHLLEAERIAPQVIRLSGTARTLLADLLSRERSALTPGLRPLAHRAGVAA